MADTHRRAAASSSRLSPEEITNRGFASAFRGVSETEVRNFLRRVADELVAMRTREADLVAQVEDLQEQLRNPAPVTEQQLLSSLGEETARVLRSAQEAAEEIRKRAEERSGGLVREAQEESGRLREDAQQHSTARKEAAEQKAAEVEAAAEARATELREDATKDAEALRELTTTETNQIRERAEAGAAEEITAAKASSRALVDEARTVRERVLADLGRRRSLLQAQVDELRSGRDRLLDAYRVVKRTLSDATDALAHVEARANAELAAPPARVVVPPVEGELEVLEGAPEGEALLDPSGVLSELDAAVEEAAGSPESEVVAPPAGDGDRPDAEDSGAAVDALFARLRASHTVDPAPGEPLPEPATADEPDADVADTDLADTDLADTDLADARVGPTEPAAPQAEALEAETRTAETTNPEPAAVAADEPEPEASDDTEAEESEPQTPDDLLRAARDEVLSPLARDLGRRAKRALQDQQNELLDRIRTIKGKVEASDVLPSEADQQSAWTPVLEEPLSAAYVHAYSDLAGKGDASNPELPGELLDELAHAMVEPWRVRLVSAIDGAGDDPEAITQRLGSRYREYRGRELEDALGDALATAWARGAYAAVPDGTRLRWIPAEEGRCPDCDDNALELIARGDPFPTGQLFPPAHPGCRCFLALAEPVPAKK